LLNKMPGDLWQRFANLRAFFGYMWSHPGKKLLFMGGEIGQWSEWNYKESLDWHVLAPNSDPRHAQLQEYVRELNRFYMREPALSERDNDPEAFAWIDPHDSDNSIISFQRKGKDRDDTLVFVCNFTPVPRYGYRLGVPSAGTYEEVLNSDASIYGGSGIENKQEMPSGEVPWQSCQNSIILTIPPLSTIVLKKRRSEAEEKTEQKESQSEEQSAN
jgi:1,4-alpha-glucan branching enzyme